MSIYIGDIPIEPIKPLSECLALLKKHKRFIKIGKNCDNDTVIITESFKIDSKYVTVLCGMYYTVNIYFFKYTYRLCYILYYRYNGLKKLNNISSK